MPRSQANLAKAFFKQLGPEHGQGLFDVLPDVRFFIKNLQGRYVFASQTLLDAHGFADPEAIIGQTDHDFIPAWLADHYVRDDRKVLAGAAIRNRIELVIRLDGMPTWHSTSKLPLHAGAIRATRSRLGLRAGALCRTDSDPRSRSPDASIAAQL